jgi:hypothetical protein
VYTTPHSSPLFVAQSTLSIASGVRLSMTTCPRAYSLSTTLLASKTLTARATGMSTRSSYAWSWVSTSHRRSILNLHSSLSLQTPWLMAKILEDTWAP